MLIVHIMKNDSHIRANFAYYMVGNEKDCFISRTFGREQK